MDNSSQITSFTFTAYGEIGRIKYLYFVISLLLYLIIIVLNVALITLIYRDKSLREPMYLFLCSLAANGLYGSTGLFPALFANFLSRTHDISRVFCFAQIFILHTYGCCEFTCLAMMAYDRYVSICHPLRYHNIMSPSRVYQLIVFTWLFAFCTFTVTILLTIRMPLCGRTIEKVYCVNYSVVKLACEDTSAFNIYGIISIIYTTFPQIILIVYSYVRILKICLTFSKSQAKALNTCTSHLIILVNFALGGFFELIQNRFDISYIPNTVQILLSVYFLICPPFLNPIIYGIRTKAIRKVIKTQINIKSLKS